MQKNIHPKLNNVVVSCASCSKEYNLKTTLKSMNVDVCCNCHPYYTNQAFSARSVGRVERFRNKYKK